MNTLETALHVSAQYHRYLQSTMRFRDADFAESFAEKMSDAPLTHGPLLEGTPVFRRGASLRQIVTSLPQLAPDEAFLRALEGDRSLYRHQEEAVRRVTAGRNAVVATGTGSGKTESFLYPILLDLLCQQQRGALNPGVRALVLYPMNALAHDQRDRLAAPPQFGEVRGGITYELHRERASLRFTFGQYIGQTPEKPEKKEGASWHGELASRTEMRVTPPHFLLTNYSMLEYLLLRPNDSPLFDVQNEHTWRYLVLDEAHQYRGTKGIEMAMLIRRLKQRLRDQGHTGEFRCIATSASLSGGANSDPEKDRHAAARFAEDLFGEPFGFEDVIFGETEPVIDRTRHRLQRQEYDSILDALESGDFQRCDPLLRAYGAPSGDRFAALSWLLLHDEAATRLRSAVLGNPTDVGTLARDFFAGNSIQAQNSLGVLAEILARLRDETGAPLLTGRYHVLLKAMENAYVTLSPQKRVLVDDRKNAGPGTFEAALCQECGQHYFVGRFEAGRLHEADRDPGSADFKVCFYRPFAEDDEDAFEGAGRDAPKTYVLCMGCAAMGVKPVECGCEVSLRVRVVEEKKSDVRDDRVTRCGACGFGGGSSNPVRELQHGHDAPQAVVATSLLGRMAQDRRKLLAFSDGRQEAAFFAWYFEQSYRDLLSRNLIRAALRDLGPGAHEAGRLARAVVAQRAASGMAAAYATESGEIDEAYAMVMREALTVERRISLEGVGLLRWRWALPPAFRAPAALGAAPFSLSEQEALRVVEIVLDTLRESKSIELTPPAGAVCSYAALGLQAAQQSVRLHGGRGTNEKNVENWDGPRTRRVLWLMKLARRGDSSLSEDAARAHATQVLLQLWDAIHDADATIRDVRQRVFVHKNTVRNLNTAWLRAAAIGEEDVVHRCDRCGRVQYEVVHECCVRARCDGVPRPMVRRHLPRDHYRDIYENDLPGALRAEEHTAQLSYELARNTQRDFKSGAVNLLSSSTTFEVGVDLGDLSTVLLRNVPPEGFNYVQRVGRAGRRSGTLGLAVTYCRRNPHDLYHWIDPSRIISGKSSAPVLVLKNDKIIRRHVSAWALSDYFRAATNRFGRVEDFFVDPMHPSAVQDIRAYLAQHEMRIRRALENIVPDGTHTADALQRGEWIVDVSGDQSRLALAEEELAHTMNSLLELEQDSVARQQYGAASWAKARAATVRQESLLTFLSSQSVIPKYGFPVDVVALDTSASPSDASRSVDLQRDLSIAISEFAPTAEVVANKLSWKSYGLKRIPAREWPRWAYRKCVEHGAFVQWMEGDEQRELPCGCSVRKGAYIVPSFGFTTGYTVKVEQPVTRPQRLFSTRPFFVGSVGDEPEVRTIEGRDGRPLIVIGRASPGRMAVLSEGSRGQPFLICSRCGFGTTKPSTTHKTHLGKDCSGMLQRTALGHVFETDVLRLQFPEVVASTMGYYGLLGAAFALASGASEIMEVPATDLSAAVVLGMRGVSQIVLYDNVPGGAGLVSRLEEPPLLMRVMHAARERVDGRCGCRFEDSCYACLRSYSNQYAHGKLQRGAAWSFFDVLIRSV